MTTRLLASDYVKNRGGDFGEAFWEVNYVRLYN